MGTAHVQEILAKQARFQQAKKIHTQQVEFNRVLYLPWVRKELVESMDLELVALAGKDGKTVLGKASVRLGEVARLPGMTLTDELELVGEDHQTLHAQITVSLQGLHGDGSGPAHS